MNATQARTSLTLLYLGLFLSMGCLAAPDERAAQLSSEESTEDRPLLPVAVPPNRIVPEVAIDPNTCPNPCECFKEVATQSLAQKAVSVLFVVDRSGSMARSLGHRGPRRWDAMQQALAHSLPLLEASPDSKVGALLFPSDNGCGVSSQPEVGLQSQAAAVLNLLGSRRPQGWTPMGKALRQAREYFSAQTPDDNSRAVVLVTDGLPNCGDNIHSTGQQIDALQALDIPTAVLGLGLPGDGNLHNLALKGGLTAANGSFYDANDPAQLSASLDRIARASSRCLYTVTSPGSEDWSINTVLNQDEPLDASQWTLDSHTGDTWTIRLETDLCAEVIDGNITVELSIDFDNPSCVPHGTLI